MIKNNHKQNHITFCKYLSQFHQKFLGNGWFFSVLQQDSGGASLHGACNKAGSPKTSSNLCVFNFIRNFSEIFPWRYGGKFWWNWKRTGLNLFLDYLPCYVRHPKMRHLSPASGQKKSSISKNSLQTKEIFRLNEPFKSDLDCWKYYVASVLFSPDNFIYSRVLNSIQVI